MKYPVFDGHNDTLTKLFFKDKSVLTFLEEEQKLHVTFPKTQEGGFFGGFFAIFIPQDKSEWSEELIKFTDNGYILEVAPASNPVYARQETDKILKTLDNLVNNSNNKIIIAKSLEDINHCLKTNKLAVVIHFEGAEVIKEDLSNLEDYYNKGLRSLGFTWSRHNAFAHGVPFEFPNSPDTGSGLTNNGKELVKRCNKLGILIDLAHINYKSFFDAYEITEKPLVVSHAGAHTLSRSTRNITDDQLNAIKESNGLIGIYFVAEMLREDGKLDKPSKSDEIIRHIDYVAENFGIDHVALGSDFDGCTLPTDIKDSSSLPILFEQLKKLGYDEESLEKIAYKNWLRVIKNTWK